MTPTTSPRIAALAANAGLFCLFASITEATGAPFAEMALPAGTGDDPSPLQLGICHTLGSAPDVILAASRFRERAVREFKAAPGLSEDVRLYLPWFCSMDGVEAFGRGLGEVLAAARLPGERAIAEVDLAPDAGDVRAKVDRLKRDGVAVAVLVDVLDDAAIVGVEALAPDFVHLGSPPRSFDEATVAKAFIERAARGSTRVIAGHVPGFDAAHAESIGVSLFYGDAATPPRFLC